MQKPRPKTGEKRARNQPLWIDRLPETVREAIAYLHNARGKNWEQIEELSAKPYSEDWAKDGGGFIDWPTVDLDVCDHFVGLRIPKTTLHRWYDLRIAQVRKEILATSASARSFAEKFGGGSIEGANEAVINALQGEVFSLAQNCDIGTRAVFMKALDKLTLAMYRIQRVELAKKQAEADIAKSEVQRKKIAASSGDPREVYLRAVADLFKKLMTREKVRAALDPIKEELVQEMTHAADTFAKQIEAAAD